MKNSPNDRLPRREFLRRSACLLGAASLALEARPSHADATPPLSLAFWDGTRLIPADRLASGDPALRQTGLRLVVSSHPGSRPRHLRALDAHFLTSVNGKDAHVPFHAWTAGPHTLTRAVFTMPVASDGTLLLSARHGGETFLGLSVGAVPGIPKLRAGHYVLAVGNPHWGGYLLEPGAESPLVRRTLGGLAPAPLEYLLLSVAPV